MNLEIPMSEIGVGAGKVSVFDGRLVEIDDKEIIINVEYLGTAMEINTRDIMRDIFAQHWRGQNITVKAQDGEPLRELGIVDFISTLCYEFSIPKNSITFVTHDDVEYPGYQKELKNLEIFWQADKFVTYTYSVNENAKFVGCTVGRCSFPRLRTMYELDHAFPNQSFIICQNKPTFKDNLLSEVRHLYTKEIAWLEQYTFQKDLDQSFVDWRDSYKNYHNIYNKYQIEVVCETHANSTYWLTEKTARCLIVGKPFVLLAGHNMLAKLRALGFQTFGSEIDESYDQEISWPARLNKIILALENFKNRPDYKDAINRLYSVGQHNRQHYLNYVQSKI